MSQLKRYNGTDWETIGGLVTGDTLPLGSEVDYDGEYCPAGWVEINDPEKYSTSETLTNKTWIDGKPIYRRVHQYTSTSNSDNINIANWNIDSITFMQGYCYDSTNRQLDTNYYVGSSDFFRVLTRLYGNNHTITVQRGNSNSRLVTIIIEYTKAS